MIFVDTGYFLALLDTRDTLHQRALQWSRGLNEPLLTTEYVVVEMFNAFSAPTKRFRPHGLLAQLRKTPQYEILPASPQLFEAGLQLHAARPDKEWSLTDCISFVVMSERDISRALAYDHHFEQAGFEPLLRREPAP